MLIEIKNRFNNKIIIFNNKKIIISGEYESVKDCLEKNKNNISFSSANLRDANLEGVNLEGANLNCANLNCANLRDAYLRDAYLGGANLNCANLEGANLEGVYLRDAYLRDANLGDAYLRDANLNGAYLEGANLEGAYLEGANLGGAYLRGAKGIKLPIVNLNGSVHSLFYMDGNIKIGCEDHSVEYWIENYESIGEDNDYTPEQIKEYKGYIDTIAFLINQNKGE